MSRTEFPSAGAASGVPRALPGLAIAMSAATLAMLALLHLLSPEFDPSWRMVSEYALGRHAWVLSLMFLCWGVSTWALSATVWDEVTTTVGRIGVWILVMAGLGEAMAAVFDVTHDLGHSVAGALGVLGLPVAALLVTRSLDHSPAWARHRRPRHWAAHLTWISTVLLIVTLVVMTVQFAHVNGGHLPAHAPQVLPPGVLGLDGWANRLLVATYCAWQIVVAMQAIHVKVGGALGAAP